MSILIVDHALCNLGSVKRAIEECGGTATISEDPAALKQADKVILPGVGSYGDAMKVLKARGWDTELKKAALIDKLPFFGMCLGMQLMSSHGVETAESEGLGLIPGKVVRLLPAAGDFRVPHMGWNEVVQLRDNPVFAGIESGKDFYFAHSFHFLAENAEHVSATTPYCGGITSAVRNGHIFGVQFHPEKSQRVGLRLLKNFIEY